MQASSPWTPPSGTLGGIVAEARSRASELEGRVAELERLAHAGSVAPPLIAALRRATVAVIAEVKRRSPSKGWIQASLSAGAQARCYADGGASAISVLTEPRHFAGSVDDLLEVRTTVALPTLKKDFHISPVQLLEAKALGASAALLIVRALSPSDLPEMMRSAAALSLEVLVEVRDEAELDRALEAGARLVGINNRNLETLEIDPRTSERLLGRVPRDVVAVAESGVNGLEDVQRLARAGADAVLVGSSVSAAADPSAAVRALSAVPRCGRGG